MGPPAVSSTGRGEKAPHREKPAHTPDIAQSMPDFYLIVFIIFIGKLILQMVIQKQLAVAPCGYIHTRA
jgi:hypothetical protein